jgi:hypothetical protein
MRDTKLKRSVPMANAREVAEWMVERLEEDEYLYQEVVVYEIQKQYGDAPGRFQRFGSGGHWDSEPPCSLRASC